MQKVVVLGSTGSIGKSSIEVIKKNKDKFNIACLVAKSNEELILDQSKRNKNSKIYLENPKRIKSSKKFNYKAYNSLL